LNQPGTIPESKPADRGVGEECELFWPPVGNCDARSGSGRPKQGQSLSLYREGTFIVATMYPLQRARMDRAGRNSDLFDSTHPEAACSDTDPPKRLTPPLGRSVTAHGASCTRVLNIAPNALANPVRRALP